MSKTPKALTLYLDPPASKKCGQGSGKSIDN